MRAVNNESLLGGLFFEIEDFPDVLVGESVLTTERTDGWSLSILDDNGKILKVDKNVNVRTAGQDLAENLSKLGFPKR